MDISPVFDSAFTIILRFLNWSFTLWGATVAVKDLFIFSILASVTYFIIKGVFH